MITRHTDGLGHVNLANMDMDEFKEFMWPGIMAKNYFVIVGDYEYEGTWESQYAFPHPNNLKPTLRPGPVDTMFYAWLPASSEKHAKRRARAMVMEYIAKTEKNPCPLS